MPSMHRWITTCTLVGLTALSAAPARAQCPDGSPPPCGVRGEFRPAPRPVPAPALRARQFLVLPFRNVSRQPDQEWLVEGSTTMLVEALSRWRGISVVPDEKLYPALRRVGVAPGTVVEAPVARRLADETGGWTAVTGEVVATGGRVRIAARAWDVPTNRELVRTTADVPVSGDMRVAFDSVSLRLLKVVGIDTVPAEFQPGTTQNVDAYRAYLRGVAAMRRENARTAEQAFEEAVRRDSLFALAWMRLGVSQLRNLMGGSRAAARSSMARAVALSGKLPRRQRTLVTANDARVNGFLTAAREHLAPLLATDSTDTEALELTGFVELDGCLVRSASLGARATLGSCKRATALFTRVVALDPGNWVPVRELARLYHRASLPLSIGTFDSEEEFRGFLNQTKTAVPASWLLMRGDSLELLPYRAIDSLATDSIQRWRTRALAAAMPWAERWARAAPGDGAAWKLVAELAQRQGEMGKALDAMRWAVDAQVEMPREQVALILVRLMALTGQSASALHLVDSLQAAGFWGIASEPVWRAWNVEKSGAALLVQLAHGRFAAATTHLEGVRRALSSRYPEQYQGNENRAAYQAWWWGPLVPDTAYELAAFRALSQMALDTVLNNVERLPPGILREMWPVLVADLAQDASERDPDWQAVLDAAARLASRGHPDKAFYLAAWVARTDSMSGVRTDSTQRPRLAAYPWYRSGAERQDAEVRAVAERIRPSTATIFPDSGVFTWTVGGDAPFAVDRANTPPNMPEFVWHVQLSTRDSTYEVLVSTGGKPYGAVPGMVPLAGVVARVPRSERQYAQYAAPDVEDRARYFFPEKTVALKTDAGGLRLVVTDTGFLETMRRERPAEAVLRFRPCAVSDGSTEPLCKGERVPIVYR